MTDSPPQEMTDLMAELGTVLVLHNLKIIELRALDLLRADTVAVLDELIRKEAKILNTVIVKQFAFNWLSGSIGASDLEVENSGKAVDIKDC